MDVSWEHLDPGAALRRTLRLMLSRRRLLLGTPPLDSPLDSPLDWAPLDRVVLPMASGVRVPPGSSIQIRGQRESHRGAVGVPGRVWQIPMFRGRGGDRRRGSLEGLPGGPVRHGVELERAVLRSSTPPPGRQSRSPDHRRGNEPGAGRRSVRRRDAGDGRLRRSLTSRRSPLGYGGSPASTRRVKPGLASKFAWTASF